MRDFQLLVIEDDDLVIQTLRMGAGASWHVLAQTDANSLPSGRFHAAMVDMHLSERQRAEGLQIIRKLRSLDPHLPIVAISGDLRRDLMEESLRAGADRFLAKPLAMEEIKLTLSKIEELWLLQDARLRSRRGATPYLGQSPAALEVQKQVAALKGERAPVLIEGETGTGKELVAQWLHAQVSDSPLISVNVAAIPENLFESEMFGHIKGAFTGADQNKMGLAEAAHGGDLFLDEIEALPLPAQAKLLRFLESGEIRRVGAREAVHVECRVIAATNRPLAELVREGKFREDLMWRLSAMRLRLPPLRERREDIADLARHFLDQDRVRKKQLEPDAIAALMEYSWPGNVRELKRVCEQLSLTAPLPVIRRSDVLRLLLPTPSVSEGPTLDFSRGLPDLLSGYEAHVIKRCLETLNDVDECARVLKISRSSLYKKIKDYNLEWKGL